MLPGAFLFRWLPGAGPSALEVVDVTAAAAAEDLIFHN